MSAISCYFLFSFFCNSTSSNESLFTHTTHMYALLLLAIPSARLWNWRLDVYLLLSLLIVVLPFYHCYLLLVTNGME